MSKTFSTKLFYTKSFSNKTFSNKTFLNPKSIAYLNQLPTQPDAIIKGYIDNFISNRIASGNFAKDDRVFLRGNQYQDGSYISIANPTSTPSTPIGTGTLRWKQFQGFITDPDTSAVALNWNYIPSIDGVNFSQDNACLWFYSLVDDIHQLEVDLRSIDPDFNQTFLYTDNNLLLNGTLNQSLGGTSKSILTTNGLFSIVRKNSTLQLWFNGVKIKEESITSNELQTTTICELGAYISGSISFTSFKRLFMSGAGSGDIDQVAHFNEIDGLAKSFGVSISQLNYWSFFGDSETYGYNLANPTEPWQWILTNNKNVYYHNRAANGQTIAAFLSSGQIIFPKNHPGEKIFLSWYINDFVAGATIDDFKANWQTVINMALAAGFSKTIDIIITKEWYITDANVLAGVPPYITAIQDIATANGITNCISLASLTYSLQNDGLHATISGHVDIANHYISIL